MYSVPNSYNEKRRLLEAQTGEIEVLCTGASHALHAIDPSQFSQRGFNLANVNQTIFYDRRITERYLPQMPKLKVLVLTLSHVSLYMQLREIGTENWRDFFYERFWNVTYPKLPWWELQRYSLMALYGKEKTYEFLSNGLRANFAPAYTLGGYVKPDTTGSAARVSDSKGRARAREHEELCQHGIAPAIMQDLQAMAATAKARGIAVAIVIPPVYKTYSRHLSPALVRQNNEKLSAICAANGYAFYDYFYDSMRYEQADFFDNDHMSYNGAAKFSRILDSEVVKPVTTAAR